MLSRRLRAQPSRQLRSAAVIGTACLSSSVRLQECVWRDWDRFGAGPSDSSLSKDCDWSFCAMVGSHFEVIASAQECAVMAPAGQAAGQHTPADHSNRLAPPLAASGGKGYEHFGMDIGDHWSMKDCMPNKSLQPTATSRSVGAFAGIYSTVVAVAGAAAGGCG
jgi:hypothetical protein